MGLVSVYGVLDLIFYGRSGREDRVGKGGFGNKAMYRPGSSFSIL